MPYYPEKNILFIHVPKTGGTKIENELGWTAEEQFDTGLKKTVSWYLQNKNWVDGCNRDEFSKGFLGKH